MANKSHNRDIYIKIPQGKNTEAENKQYNRNTNMNKKLIRLTEGDLHRIVKESVNRILNESLCSSGNKEYDYLSNSLFSLIEDWGISEQMNQNKTFQEGRKMLHQALKTLEAGFREYNNYEDTGGYDGGEGFSDYSGGSLY
jgi:hypothetical protein